MSRIDVAALADRLAGRPLTRFAPSPTGCLHLGHVVNAVYVWGLAGALGGRVMLRLEDHDRTRCRPDYERAVPDDLEWLGLEPDLPGLAHLRNGPSPYRQSDSEEAYQDALRRLAAKDLVFACDCSRREIDAEAGGEFNRETRYPGRCRDRRLPLHGSRRVRLRVGPGEERFLDGRLGKRSQDPSAQCGDLLLRDRLGHWTYQFSVVVDDIRHGVDLVIRGRTCSRAPAGSSGWPGCWDAAPSRYSCTIRSCASRTAPS